MNDLDRAIILACQAGLPLVPRPYHLLADSIGIAPEALMARLREMQTSGIIRRIGVLPNHYALGYRANGMTVWNVDDEHIDRLGEQIGALDFVSHCYQRPRYLPDWPYNLFAMVHGQTRQQVEAKVVQIADLLGKYAKERDILYSTRILKKAGVRLRAHPAPSVFS